MKYILLVTSDLPPVKGMSYEYNMMSAAALLSVESAKDKGFIDFKFKTALDSDYGIKISGDIDATGGNFNFLYTNDFLSKVKISLTNTIEDYLLSIFLDLKKANFKLIITEYSENFAYEIADNIGIQKDCVISNFDKLDKAFTSSLIAGYYYGTKHELIKQDDIIIFAGCGSGITSAIGSYIV